MKLKYRLVVFLLFVIFLAGCPVDSGSDSGGSSGSSGSSGSNGNNPDPGGTDNTKNDAQVTILSASKYEYPGIIKLTWKSIKGAGKYRIYRYSSKDEQNSLLGHYDFFYNTPDVIDNLTSDDVIALRDNFDTPFFYKISCFINDVESEKSDFVYGVCSTAQDIHEPGSDEKPSSDAGQTVFIDVENNPYVLHLNSYPDGVGSSVSDVDWYKLKRKREVITFSIQSDLLKNYSVARDEIRIEFYYGNDLNPKYTELIQLPNTTCIFGDLPEHYNNEIDDGNLVDVYFRLVYDKTSTTDKKLFNYKIVM